MEIIVIVAIIAAIAAMPKKLRDTITKDNSDLLK